MSLRAHGEAQTDEVSFLSTELPSGTAHQGPPGASVLARPLTSPLYCWSSHQWVLRVPSALALLPNISPGPNIWIQRIFFTPPAWIFFLAFCMTLALPLQPPSLFVTLTEGPLCTEAWRCYHCFWPGGNSGTAPAWSCVPSSLSAVLTEPAGPDFGTPFTSRLPPELQVLKDQQAHRLAPKGNRSHILRQACKRMAEEAKQKVSGGRGVCVT